MTPVSDTLGRKQLRQTTHCLSITVRILANLRCRACVREGSLNILKGACTLGRGEVSYTLSLMVGISEAGWGEEGPNVYNGSRLNPACVCVSVCM